MFADLAGGLARTPCVRAAARASMVLLVLGLTACGDRPAGDDGAAADTAASDFPTTQPEPPPEPPARNASEDDQLTWLAGRCRESADSLRVLARTTAPVLTEAERRAIRPQAVLGMVAEAVVAEDTNVNCTGIIEVMKIGAGGG